MDSWENNHLLEDVGILWSVGGVGTVLVMLSNASSS